MTCLLAILLTFLLGIPHAGAQIGPVGPKTDSVVIPPSGDEGRPQEPRPQVDVPYKPRKRDPEPTPTSPLPPEKKPEPVIPFIPSKAPEPVGAPDPQW